MKKSFLDICYEILSHYLNFPDVADTVKSISDGIHYLNNFPRSQTDFEQKKYEIIHYIQKVRSGNVIDAYKEKDNPFLYVPAPSGRLLSDLEPEELYRDLNAEILRLILKGTHQTIKHLNIVEDDNKLTAELLQQDTSVLQKYGLLSGEGATDGQTQNAQH